MSFVIFFFALPTSQLITAAHLVADALSQLGPQFFAGTILAHSRNRTSSLSWRFLLSLGIAHQSIGICLRNYLTGRRSVTSCTHDCDMQLCHPLQVAGNFLLVLPELHRLLRVVTLIESKRYAPMESQGGKITMHLKRSRRLICCIFSSGVC